MNAYLISWKNFVEDVAVLRFDGVADAEGHLAERLSDDRTAFVAASVEDMSAGLTHSVSVLLKLYNSLGPDKPVAKFESREAGARRTFALLEARHRNDPVPLQEEHDVTDDEGQTKADAKAAKDAAREQAKAAKAVKSAERETAAAAKKAAKTDEMRLKGGKAAAGRPPKDPSEFKQVREGTFRAALLRAMDGTRTAEEIGRVHHKETSLVLSHAFCLTRDCGIGYDFVDGKIRARFPQGKTLADAIRPVVTA